MVGQAGHRSCSGHGAQGALGASRGLRDLMPGCYLFQALWLQTHRPAPGPGQKKRGAGGQRADLCSLHSRLGQKPGGHRPGRGWARRPVPPQEGPYLRRAASPSHALENGDSAFLPPGLSPPWTSPRALSEHRCACILGPPHTHTCRQLSCPHPERSPDDLGKAGERAEKSEP